MLDCSSKLAGKSTILTYKILKSLIDVFSAPISAYGSQIWNIRLDTLSIHRRKQALFGILKAQMHGESTTKEVQIGNIGNVDQML